MHLVQTTCILIASSRARKAMQGITPIKLVACVEAAGFPHPRRGSLSFPSEVCWRVPCPRSSRRRSRPLERTAPERSASRHAGTRHAGSRPEKTILVRKRLKNRFGGPSLQAAGPVIPSFLEKTSTSALTGNRVRIYIAAIGAAPLTRFAPLSLPLRLSLVVWLESWMGLFVFWRVWIASSDAAL